MTNEELMKPRCKAIAPDTSGNFEVGEIFYPEKNGSYYFYGHNGKKRFVPKYYPHLFRELEWWEERKVEDMPQYVKHGERLREVKKWAFDSARPGSPYFTWHGDDVGAYVDFFPGCDPATEAEYLAALNTTKQQDNG